MERSQGGHAFTALALTVDIIPAASYIREGAVVTAILLHFSWTRRDVIRASGWRTMCLD